MFREFKVGDLGSVGFRVLRSSGYRASAGP